MDRSRNNEQQDSPRPPDTPSVPPWEPGVLRVFLSYSHEDRELAERIAGVLEDLGLVPLYDRMVRPGSAFTDAIKGLISHAHIFMPLITEQSQGRPWVHQEIGYAMALNIPVLPVSTIAGLGEMIAHFQAIVFEPHDVGEVRSQLLAMDLDRFVKPRPDPLLSIHEIADWPEKRAELMGRAAQRVLDMGYKGRLLQRAGLSSFSIPDADTEDPIWKARDGDSPRSDYYHHCLREERRCLEIHARAQGCDLLIDPQAAVTGSVAAGGAAGVDQNTNEAVSAAGLVDSAKLVRLRCLIDFLESFGQGKHGVRVVCSPIAKQASTTILGEWFCSDTRLRLPREGWRQTIFTWHAPTVRLARERLQDLFDAQLIKQFGSADVAEGETRRRAIELLQAQVDQLTQRGTGASTPRARRAGAAKSRPA